MPSGGLWSCSYTHRTAAHLQQQLRITQEWATFCTISGARMWVAWPQVPPLPTLPLPAPYPVLPTIPLPAPSLPTGSGPMFHWVQSNECIRAHSMGFSLQKPTFTHRQILSSDPIRIFRPWRSDYPKRPLWFLASPFLSDISQHVVGLLYCGSL